VPEVIRCVLLCMLEAVEGKLCFLEVLEGVGGAGGDAVCAALYARGCRGYVLFAGGATGDAPCAALYAEGCVDMEVESKALEVRCGRAVVEA